MTDRTYAKTLKVTFRTYLLSVLITFITQQLRDKVILQGLPLLDPVHYR